MSWFTRKQSPTADGHRNRPVDIHHNPEDIGRPNGSEDLLRALLATTFENNALLRVIVEELRGIDHRAVSLTLTLEDEGQPMNTKQIVVATVNETDSLGNNVPVDATKLQFSIDDTTVASVTANGDNTATVTAIAAGKTSLRCVDSSNGLSAEVDIEVSESTTGKATELTITLGTATDAPGSTAA
jgi:hypothetical protein